MLLASFVGKKIYTDGILFGNKDKYVFLAKRKCMRDTKFGWINYMRKTTKTIKSESEYGS